MPLLSAREALACLGGEAEVDRLLALTTRHALRKAVADGSVVRVRRGRYAVHHDEPARAAAARLSGVISHYSAALAWGWALKWSPPNPAVTVPRGRHLTPAARAGVLVRQADLGPEEICGGLTSPRRTLVDCARLLPFDEALAIADSALRQGRLTTRDLDELARTVGGPGRPRIRRVLTQADGRAANPFESVLRAIALEQPGFRFVAQQPVAVSFGVIHPDLVDPDRRVVLEADGFQFHSDRLAHARDCSRYNALVLAGWLVLRFTWENVMTNPAYVRRALAQAAAIAPQVSRHGGVGA